MKFTAFLAFLCLICDYSKAQLNTVAGSGNTSSYSIFINGNTNYNVGNYTGLSLYYLNGASYLESGNPSTSVLAPLNLKGSVINLNRTIIKGATDDTSYNLITNGKIKLGNNSYSGDISMTGKIATPLVTRLKESDNSSIVPVTAGDLMINNFWGVAINLDRGLYHDNSLATYSVLKSTSSFTINNFTSDSTLNTLLIVRNSGNVGIGITNPQEKLAVNGTVVAKKVRVTSTGWPDYVFNENYQLPSLKETAAYIKNHKHLPGIPAAAEVAQNGQDLGEMNKLLLQKVEELTLHLIELQAKVEKLEAARQ
ncbi:hypothetical protein [Chitinophaga sp.]|uniref:hypothetical protein n=1 Tax=Chitinophaga sp. TaxID=1869181 RepID=UPI0031CE87F8